MHIRHPDFEPLPPFADPRTALKRALPALRPARRMSVTEAAERFMRVRVDDQWKKFRRDVTPYMIEPTDMIASRAYRSLIFCGPSQSGKTQMLQSAIAWAITCNPGRVALFQMTRDAAAEFERNKLAPMIRNSPDIKAAQSTGRGSDNIFQKLFDGGTQLSINWPTITQLSSATIRLLLGTDYDHFPASIEGEGDAHDLMRARAMTYQSRGMVVIESSPGAPVIDEAWRPDSPHSVPPVKYGVLAHYPSGTRARWYWTCPDCDGEFEPRFERLRYPDATDPAEAGEAAEMSCPHCGSLHGHHLKREFNAQGRWLHETSDGEVCPVSDPRVRKTDKLSYWLAGPAAAFSPWSTLVSRHLEGVEKYEATGDEESLKATLNTLCAMPYTPRAARDENEVTLQGLRDKQAGAGIDTPKATAPEWARYLTVSVDTQSTRWDVGVTAWGVEGRHQIIDRFDVAAPPASAPDAADRTVRPFDCGEDWDALTSLADMIWPVAGTRHGLRAAAIALDMQGGAATTENAYAFYRARRKSGQGRLWYLTRGQGGRHTDRVWLKEPERVSGKARRGRKVAVDVKIMNMATDRLKDAVASSLRRTDGGANVCHIPMWVPEAHLIEMTAERRTEKGWEKRPGMVRNEALDHLVQARALMIQMGAEKIQPDMPPAWAIGGPENTNAAAIVAAAPAETAPVPIETSAPRPDPRPALPRRVKYFGR